MTQAPRLPQHARLLTESAIAAAVSEARGYRSATTKAELISLGFSGRQARAPALLIPVRGVTGEIATYQLRPDDPRIDERGRAVKYETPLSEFGTLWRNPAVPDHLREEAIREIFERFDVDGPEIVAAHPQPSENAWLLGLVAVKDERLRMQRVMGLVGARGIAPR